MKSQKKIVAIIYTGTGLESEISVKTSQAIAQALDELSYSYFLVEADKKLTSVLLDQKPDIAFLAVHGVYGEDGCVQAICEFLSIPYTGSGVLTSALCMDKLFLKKILLQNKIATPKFQIVDENWDSKNITKYPIVVKASHGGSTLGTYIAQDLKSLNESIQKAKEIGRFVFVEDYIPSAQEINVSYLDGQILTPVEVVPKGGFYDYKRKYEKFQSQYYVPSKLDDFVIEKIKHISEKIFSLVGVRSYARTDFLIENGSIPWFLEVNTLPGLTATSLLPKSAAHDGIDFNQLIEKIINKAQVDYKV